MREIVGKIVPSKSPFTGGSTVLISQSHGNLKVFTCFSPCQTMHVKSQKRSRKHNTKLCQLIGVFLVFRFSKFHVVEISSLYNYVNEIAKPVFRSCLTTYQFTLDNLQNSCQFQVLCNAEKVNNNINDPF